MENQDTSVLIERGNAAEQLLQSPAFVGVANTLLDMYMGDILRSDAKDTQAREMAYAHARAVQDIVGVMNQWVAIRDQIVINNDAQQETTD